jgi:hypothetical protein
MKRMALLVAVLAVAASSLALASSPAKTHVKPMPFTFYMTHYVLLGDDPNNPTGVRCESTGKPTAKARDGSTIALSGQGGWDPAAARVSGGGRYTITDPAGAVTKEGTWRATRFVSFKQLPGWWGDPRVPGGRLAGPARLVVVLGVPNPEGKAGRPGCRRAEGVVPHAGGAQATRSCRRRDLADRTQVPVHRLQGAGDEPGRADVLRGVGSLASWPSARKVPASAPAPCVDASPPMLSALTERFSSSAGQRRATGSSRLARWA